MALSVIQKEQKYHKLVPKETLLALVKAKPQLWDSSLEMYKDKGAKAAAWRAICIILRNDYNELDSREKHEFGKFVVKKWSQTRDAWVRTLKQEKTCKKSGLPSRPYRYHDQMLFLRKVINVDIASSSNNDESQNDTPNSSAKKRKALSDEDGDASPVRSSLDHNEAEDRILSFFKSLLPSVSSLNDDQTLEFQTGVLKLLHNIKKRPACSKWENQLGSYAKSEDTRSSAATSASAKEERISEKSAEVPEIVPLYDVKIKYEPESDHE